MLDLNMLFSGSKTRESCVEISGTGEGIRFSAILPDNSPIGLSALCSIPAPPQKASLLATPAKCLCWDPVPTDTRLYWLNRLTVSSSALWHFYDIQNQQWSWSGSSTTDMCSRFGKSNQFQPKKERRGLLYILSCPQEDGNMRAILELKWLKKFLRNRCF